MVLKKKYGYMGQSYIRIALHLIFSTKGREPIIDSSIEAELYSYLGGTCGNLDCRPIKVGGYRDHVHVLCFMSPKITLMKLVEIIKSHSSKWIKSKGVQYGNFYWQDGYAAFSLSPSDIGRVARYIENQTAHHRKVSFKDELLGILSEHHVDYDERYLWR
jgi:putative transposase